MQLTNNGIQLDVVYNIQQSVLGNSHVFMSDVDGVPIHIHRDVIEALYKQLHPPVKQPFVQPPVPLSKFAGTPHKPQNTEKMPIVDIDWDNDTPFLPT